MEIKGVGLVVTLKIPKPIFYNKQSKTKCLTLSYVADSPGFA